MILSVLKKLPPHFEIIDENGKSHNSTDVVNDVKMWVSYLTQKYPQSDSVSLLGKNSYQWILAALACWELKRTLVPLPSNLSKFEIKNLIKDFNLEPVINIDLTRIERFHQQEKTSDFDNNFHALTIFTSGSSGKPKGVNLSWRALSAHAEMSMKFLSLTNNDRWLITLPFYHIGGISAIFKMLETGISLIIPPAINSDSLSSSIETYQPTASSMVTTVFDRLLDRWDRINTRSLRFILLGGGPVNPKYNEMDERLLSTYGMSEAGSQICTVPPVGTKKYQGTCGIPLPGVSLKIAAQDSHKENNFGEILVKTPAAFDGYKAGSELTKSTYQDGWIQTGDFGHIREDGALVLHGSRFDRIRSGGENIDPVEVERAIDQHKHVKRVVVVPLEDDVWSEVVAALIETDHPEILKEELEEHLNKSLSRIKHPKVYSYIEAIPELDNGKINYSEVIEILNRARGEDS